MIRYLLAVMAAVFWVTSQAAAIDCSAERDRSDKGHWSWRMIDGKKCWYRGQPGVSKAKLRWPETTVGKRARKAPENAPPAAAAPEGAVVPAPRRNVVRSDEQEDAQPGRDLTFRERWPH